jgi:hypothetical protein
VIFSINPGLSETVLRMPTNPPDASVCQAEENGRRVITTFSEIPSLQILRFGMETIQTRFSNKKDCHVCAFGPVFSLRSRALSDGSA